MATYTIKQGDTLSGLAKQNNTSVDALLAANPTIKDPNKIYAGQQLSLTSTPTVPSSTVPVTGSQPLTKPTTSTTPSLTGNVDRTAAFKQVNDIKTQLDDLNKQAAALKKWGLNDTNLLEKNEVGDYVPKANATNLVPSTSGGITTTDTIRNDETTSKYDKFINDVDQLRTQQKQITDLQNKKTISDLKTSLGVNDAPVTPALKSDYEAVRGTYGLSGIETRMRDVDSQIAALQSSLTEGLNNEEGRLAPMELVTGRQAELQKQGNAKIQLLQNSKALLQDEYNTKLGIVDKIMSLEQQDFSNASATYQTKFTQAIQIQELFGNQKQQEISNLGELTDDEMTLIKERQDQINLEKTDAAANLSVVLDYAQGIDSSTISEESKTMITKLGMQAGIPREIIDYAVKQKMDNVASGLKVTPHFTELTDAEGNVFTQMINVDENGGLVSVKNIYGGGVATKTIPAAPADETPKKTTTTSTTEATIPSFDSIGSTPAPVASSEFGTWQKIGNPGVTYTGIKKPGYIAVSDSSNPLAAKLQLKDSFLNL